MMTETKHLDYYMNLAYKVEMTPDESGSGFNAKVPLLKGCMSFGETIEDAYQTLIEVKQAWIEIAMERGWTVPEPPVEEAKEYSGKFNVCLPLYLHRELVTLAEVEGTSLNQLVVALLAEGTGTGRSLPLAAAT